MYLRKIHENNGTLEVSIPKDLGRFLGWIEGDFLIFRVDDNRQVKLFKIDREHRPDLFENYDKEEIIEPT